MAVATLVRRTYWVQKTVPAWGEAWVAASEPVLEHDRLALVLDTSHK